MVVLLFYPFKIFDIPESTLSAHVVFLRVFMYRQLSLTLENSLCLPMSTLHLPHRNPAWPVILFGFPDHIFSRRSVLETRILACPHLPFSPPGYLRESAVPGRHNRHGDRAYCPAENSPIYLYSSILLQKDLPASGILPLRTDALRLYHTLSD